jgi:hypothetical protein
MKYLFIALASLAIFVACNNSPKGANGVVYKSAVEYNDYIVSRQTKIMQQVMDFVHASQVDLDSADRMLDTYVADIGGTIKEIEGMPAFKKDTSFRNAAIETFGFYKKIFGNEYKQLINIHKTGQSETEEGQAQMHQIVQSISDEEAKYDQAFHNAQRNFADKNHMKLEQNSMQKDIDKMKE